MKAIETSKGLLIEVFVKPNSKEFKITIDEDELVVFCTEEPTKGKVNKELIKELGRLFRKNVELVSGFASRQKRLLVRNAKRSDLEEALTRK